MKAWWVLLVLASASWAAEPAKAPLDGPQERMAFYRQVQNLRDQEDFEALEKMNAELLKSGERFVEGVWKWARFYAALDNFRRTEEDFTAQMEFLNRWEKAYPESILPDIFRSEAHTAHAWMARGDGWASEVTEEGWKLFKERLAVARKVLDGVKARNPPVLTPGWYQSMQIVALGQGWSREEYDTLFAEAEAAYPEYYDFYFNRTYWLQPKWHGEEGEWLRVAEKSADTLGDELYARIVWGQMAPWSSNSVLATDVNWPRMKRGFDRILERWPGSRWNLSAYCAYACEKGDRETARTLFGKLAGHFNPKAWKSKKQFEDLKIWAEGS